MMDMEAEDIEEKILREHDIIFGNGGSDQQQGRRVPLRSWSVMPGLIKVTWLH